MSKYIDASLFVEMQIYDDEHEEWSLWNGTIEDLLNQWTEEGRPTAIEVSEDCIGRADLIESFLADNECEREEAKACMCSLDLMLELIENAPSVVPTVSEDCISRQKAIETCDKMYPKVDRQDIKAVIEATPSVTPTERTGEWIKNDDYVCDQCGYHMIVGGGAYNFCPNCGAYMGGDTE